MSKSVITVSVVVYAPPDVDPRELLLAVQSAEGQDYPEDCFDVLVALDQYHLGEDACHYAGVTQANTMWVTFMSVQDPMKHPGALRNLMNRRFQGEDVPVWTTEEWLDDHAGGGL